MFFPSLGVSVSSCEPLSKSTTTIIPFVKLLIGNYSSYYRPFSSLQLQKYNNPPYSYRGKYHHQHDHLNSSTTCGASKTVAYKTITRGKMNYSRFLNEHALKKEPSLIREMTKMMATAGPGTIFMAGGFPNPEMFPFESIAVSVDKNTEIHLEGSSIRSALQYQPTLGFPPLVAELKKLVLRTHNPPTWNDMEGIVTVGSQHGLSGILEMVLKKGDPILVPQPVYSSALSIMDPYEPVYLAVPEDSQGMQPSLLKSTLDNWASSSNSHEKHQMPKLLYINPTGTNPSGVVIPTERKKEIYRLAQEYDFLILEDDPYYFLHFEEKEPESFLSMDTDGRVIRLDSFSKILSSGIRVGFATGPKEIIRALELSTQHSILHCSSLSQVIVHRILEQWGSEGFLAHTNKVKEFYRKRRDLMVGAAEKHLQGLAEWHVPKGGMFLWMKVPELRDTYSMIMDHGIKQGVMLLPGREFMPNKSDPCQYVRASFSVAPAEDIDEGFMRLRKLILDEIKSSK